MEMAEIKKKIDKILDKNGVDSSIVTVMKDGYVGVFLNGPLNDVCFLDRMLDNKIDLMIDKNTED